MQVVLIAFAFFAVMFAIERIVPARLWAPVPGWWSRALLLNIVQVATVFVAGATWDRWFPELSLWHLDHLGTYGSALVGYLVITFVYYWWHRARHDVGFLWRWLHQIHHSPQRIELITSFYKHPVEILINGILSSAILYLVLGLDPAAASLAVLFTGIAELVYHWNVRTPYITGFFFQRPESHCWHHRRESHSGNYSDLPLWDMIFGTFHNPRTVDWQCGFDDDREIKLGAMLIGRDVHVPRSE